MIYFFSFLLLTDSPVRTADDGDMWLLAKESFQVTDFAYVEMVEHLLRTHLMMEPFCVCLLRQLSGWHPIHQLMKYHCRQVGVMLHPLTQPYMISGPNVQSAKGANGGEGPKFGPWKGHFEFKPISDQSRVAYVLLGIWKRDTVKVTLSRHISGTKLH